MNKLEEKIEHDAQSIPNGAAAAAILAAGIGCAAIGLLAFANEASPVVKGYLNLYNPTGPLSGVTTVAVVVWLASWYLLNLRWCSKTVSLGKINVAAFVGLAIGLLLTFPPFVNFLKGE
jgi:hypothetical protein